MTILFRHLLRELMKPLLFCLVACAAIWIVIDLFGSIDEFLDRKAPFGLVLGYYVDQLPRLAQQVIPPAFLFSALFLLLNLSRRQEWTALQAAGISPWTAFQPLAFVAIGLTMLLLWVCLSLTARAEDAREAARHKLKGEPAHPVQYSALVYAAPQVQRLWFLGRINLETGEGKDVELLQKNADGRDVEKYFAARARWMEGHWRFMDVRQVSYGPEGNVTSEVVKTEIDLPEVTEPPAQMRRDLPDAETLSAGQLLTLLESLRGEPRRVLAPYETQLHQAIAYPFCVLVFLIYAVAFGARSDRRSTTAGVFNAVFVLLAYLFVLSFFLQMGRSARLAAPVAAWLPELIFAGGAAFSLWWKSSDAAAIQSQFRSWWNLVRHGDPGV